MASYGIYGAQYGAAAPAQKPKATDIFTGNSPAAVAQGAQPSQSSPATGAPPPGPFGATAGANPFAGVKSFPPVAPAQNPGGFEALLNGAQPARAQNVAGAQQAISDMLMAPTGPSRESEAARSAFVKAQTEAQRQGAEQSALSGRLQTGQIGGDADAMRQKGLTQRADLENQLAISDSKRADANRQAGISALLGMEGLGEQAHSAEAQNAVTIRGQDIQDKQATASIASTEKIAFANLSQEDKRLAQEGSQFATRQEFDKWALTKQLDDKTADRVWQGIENEKDRSLKAGENALDRALNSSQFSEKMGLENKQLSETIRQFNSREDFDRWAKNTDVDEAERNRVWQGNQEAVKQKWQTGERLSSQEHEVLLEKMQEDNQAKVMERNQVLNLDTLEKQQVHEERMLGFKDTYEGLRAKDGYSHEETMAQIEAKIASDLSAQGYSQDQALQGAHLEAQRIEGERSREMEERVSMAQLASSNSIASAELGIKKEQLDLAREELTAQLNDNAAMLGMKKEEFATAMEDQRFKRALDTAAVLTEKWGDNPDTQAKAAEILFGGLRDVGMMTDAQYRSGVLSAKLTSFKDKAAGAKWALENGYSQAEIDKAVTAAPAPKKKTSENTMAEGTTGTTNGSKSSGGGGTSPANNYG